MTTDKPTPPIDVPAAILAALFPGAGQMFRGQLYRGVMACVGVMGLFLGGILIGGIDVIDSKEDKIWFMGQALVGPAAFGVDTLHQNRFKAWAQVQAITGRPTWEKRSGYPTESRVWSDANNRYEWQPSAPSDDGAPTIGPPNTKSIAKMNEIGTLYATIAGMLNFIIFLDALMPAKRGRSALDGVPVSADVAAHVAVVTAASEASV